MPQNLKGAFLALTAFGIFSAHDVIVKYLGGTYHTVQIVFFSVLLSFPLVMLMLIRDKVPSTLRPVHPWLVAIRTIAIVVTSLAAFYAFSTIPMAQVYVILFATPLAITLMAIPMLGESVGFRRGAAIVVGLVGVVIAVRPGAEPLTYGHLAAFLCIFTGALASVLVRKIGHGERDAVLILYPMLVNFVVMAVALPFVYVPMPIIDLAAVGLMGVMSLGAMTLLIMGYKEGEASTVAPMQYSQIVWAVIFGAMFFDEMPDTWTLIGATIIIGSGVYIVLREARSSASENRPVLRARPRFETGISPRLKFFRLFRRKAWSGAKPAASEQEPSPGN